MVTVTVSSGRIVLLLFFSYCIFNSFSQLFTNPHAHTHTCGKTAFAVVVVVAAAAAKVVSLARGLNPFCQLPPSLQNVLKTAFKGVKDAIRKE